RTRASSTDNSSEGRRRDCKRATGGLGAARTRAARRRRHAGRASAARRAMRAPGAHVSRAAGARGKHEGMPMRRLTPALLLMLAAVAWATPAGSTAGEPARSREPVVSITRHSGEFNGETVHYTATVRENFLSGPDGIPNAHLVTIAYVRDGVPDPAQRPVAFVFNGGLGASSSPLHMDGIGSRIREGDTIRPNPYSLLDAVDLVFIDPVGAGFSRNFTTEAGKQYWSRTGDAKSVATVIARWLRDNGREA